MKYLQYCDYLKKKYGEITETYFIRKNCKSNNKFIPRLKEGLFIHHIRETDTNILSKHDYAIKYPFEWQQGENLVYCDAFEHLFLHVLICEEYLPISLKYKKEDVGISGILNYIVPIINDLYSGYKYYRMENVFSKIKKDKDVYLLLLKRTIDAVQPLYRNRNIKEELKCSLIFKKDLWNPDIKNKLIYDEIDKL